MYMYVYKFAEARPDQAIKCFSVFAFIHLRQGLSLILELVWQLAGSSNPCLCPQ